MKLFWSQPSQWVSLSSFAPLIGFHPGSDKQSTFVSFGGFPATFTFFISWSICCSCIIIFLLRKLSSTFFSIIPFNLFPSFHFIAISNNHESHFHMFSIVCEVFVLSIEQSSRQSSATGLCDQRYQPEIGSFWRIKACSGAAANFESIGWKRWLWSIVLGWASRFPLVPALSVARLETFSGLKTCTNFYAGTL